VAAFQDKLGANDLNCVDVPLNSTHPKALKIEVYKYPTVA